MDQSPKGWKMGETLWYRYMYQINCGLLPRHIITDRYAFHVGLWFTILWCINWHIYIYIYVLLKIYFLHIYYYTIHVHLSWTNDYNNLVKMGKRGWVGCHIYMYVWSLTIAPDLTVKKIKVEEALSTWI